MKINEQPVIIFTITVIINCIMNSYRFLSIYHKIITITLFQNIEIFYIQSLKFIALIFFFLQREECFPFTLFFITFIYFQEI